MATSDLLTGSLEQSIVNNATMLAQAATANHQSQLNNNSRNAELLGKRVVEWDGAEAIAHAEGYSRISPTSQPYHLASGINQLSGVIQNNQNLISQGFMQLNSSIEGLKTVIMAGMNKAS